MQWTREINPPAAKKSRNTLSGVLKRTLGDLPLPKPKLQIGQDVKVVEWNGYFLLAYAVHSSAFGFPKLHPRSLLERR
jgi:hypothetical protein